MDAEPGAQVFPGWSVVYCSESDQKKYPDDRIGTIRRPRFGATLRKAPKGLFTGHFCGTLEQFANGAIYDPDAPPIPIAANGWPKCCNPPPLALGGPGIGGESPFTVEGIPFGPSCCLAETAAVSTTYTSTISTNTELQYWRWDLPPGNYRFTLTALTPHRPTFGCGGFAGMACDNTLIFKFGFIVGSADFTMDDNNILCVDVGDSGGLPFSTIYTVRIDPLP